MDEDDRQGAQTSKTRIHFLLCSNYLTFGFVQYASEDAELLLVGNKLDCESDRAISRQQAERVRLLLF